MYSLEVVRWEVVVVNNGHGGSQSHAHNQNFWTRKRPTVTDMSTPLRVAQEAEGPSATPWPKTERGTYRTLVVGIRSRFALPVSWILPHNYL